METRSTGHTIRRWTFHPITPSTPVKASIATASRTRRGRPAKEGTRISAPETQSGDKVPSDISPALIVLFGALKELIVAAPASPGGWLVCAAAPAVGSLSIGVAKQRYPPWNAGQTPPAPVASPFGSGMLTAPRVSRSTVGLTRCATSLEHNKAGVGLTGRFRPVLPFQALVSPFQATLRNVPESSCSRMVCKMAWC
jgi:hypothetical protein